MTVDVVYILLQERGVVELWETSDELTSVAARGEKQQRRTLGAMVEAFRAKVMDTAGTKRRVDWAAIRCKRAISITLYMMDAESRSALLRVAVSSTVSYGYW